MRILFLIFKNNIKRCYKLEQEELRNQHFDRKRKKEFDMFLISESKGYICPNCVPKELEMSKINYLDKYTAEVTLKCNECDYSKTIELSNFDI